MTHCATACHPEAAQTHGKKVPLTSVVTLMTIFFLSSFCPETGKSNVKMVIFPPTASSYGILHIML